MSRTPTSGRPDASQSEQLADIQLEVVAKGNAERKEDWQPTEDDDKNVAFWRKI
jgi:hypothetical protein